MIGIQATPERVQWTRALSLVAVAGIVTLLATVCLQALMRGGKIDFTIAIMAALAPFCLYLALYRPMLFPFAFYVALVPFDNLLNIAAFGTLTKLLAIGSAAAMLVWILRYKKVVAPLPAWRTWALVLLWMASSAMWALEPSATFYQLTSYVQLFLFFSILAIMPVRWSEMKLILLAVLLGSVIAAAFGIYQFHAGAEVSHARLFIRSTTATIDPNHFAAALLLPLSLGLVCALRTRNLWSKLALLGASAICFLGILVTASRGSLLATVAIIMYIFWRTRYRVQLAIATAVAALAGIAFDPQAFLRFTTATETGGAGRVSIWHVGVEAFKHSWLVGAGLANFQYAYDRYFIHVYQSYYADWHRVSHNLLIGMGVDLGIIGLFLILAGWYGLFRTLRAIGADHPLFDLRVALEAALLGLFIAAMFLDVMPYKYPWLTFGLIALTYSVARSLQIPAAPPSSPTARVSHHANDVPPLLPAVRQHG